MCSPVNDRASDRGSETSNQGHIPSYHFKRMRLIYWLTIYIKGKTKKAKVKNTLHQGFSLMF